MVWHHFHLSWSSFHESCLSHALFFWAASLLHLHLVSYSAFSSFPPLFCALQLLKFFSSFFLSSIFSIHPPFSAFHIWSLPNEREKMLMHPPHFSLIRPGCGEAGPLPRVELCLCCGHSKEQAIKRLHCLSKPVLNHAQRWFVGRCNPSLNQQLDFRAPVHGVLTAEGLVPKQAKQPQL